LAQPKVAVRLPFLPVTKLGTEVAVRSISPWNVARIVTAFGKESNPSEVRVEINDNVFTLMEVSNFDETTTLIT
jgi:hypothetical protein